MTDFAKLAAECDEAQWRPDDRYPSPGDCYSGHLPPPRQAPTPTMQLNVALKALAALCRTRLNG